MIRKLTLGLIAAASLGAAALAPGAASAHGIGWHHHGWHGGFGHGYHSPRLYVSGLSHDCMQRRVVETRRGQRVRWVNVCSF